MVNPSMHGPNMEELVKIGYAVDPEKRREILSHHSGVPTDFKIYATYAVPTQLADKEIHLLIKTLNPSLKLNKHKEFFIMTPENAYKIFETMAIIHGTQDCLKKSDDYIVKKNKKEKIFEEFEKVKKHNNKYFLYPSIPNITGKKLVSFCFMSKIYFDHVCYSKMLSIIVDYLYQNGYKNKILDMASKPNIKFIDESCSKFINLNHHAISKNCFINLNFSANDILRKIKKIMNYCEINLSEFYFSTEQ